MIKRLLQIAAFTLLCTTLLNAQNTMKVVLTNGTSQSYSIESLQELVFLGQATWKAQMPSEFDGGKVYLIIKNNDGTTEQIDMAKSGDYYTLSREASVGDEYTYGIDFGGVFYTDKKDYQVSDNFIMNDDASADEFLEGLKLSTIYVQLEAGQSQTIKAFWHKSEVTPAWLSNNKAVATITAGGTIYGVGKGTATVTATYNGQTQNCTVQVDNEDPRTAGFNYYVFYMDDATFETIESQVAQDYRVNDEDIFLDVYENSYKSKSCEGLNAYGQDVDWLHFEAQKEDWNAGAAGIRVQNDIKLSKIDGSYNLHIDYKSSDNSKSYVSLYNVATNEEKQILLPTSSDGQWHSFDKSIGELGLDASWFTDYTYTSGKGQTVVGMKTEGVGMDLEWCAIYLYQHNGLVINQTSLTLKEGATSTIKAFKGGSEVTPSWSSDNTSVATVSAAGVVTAKGAGTTKIKATLDSETAECTVTVKAIDPRLVGFNYYVLLMDQDTYGEIEENVKYDYRVNDSDRFFDMWEDSYKEGTCIGKNAYDKEETWLSLVAQSAPWSGVGAGGIRSKADVKLSGINESYRLHVDYKSSDGALNELCIFNMSDHTEKWIKLYEGVTDGEWHSFDKSIKEMKIPVTWFSDWTYSSGNGEYIIAVRTTGANKQLDWCSIFLYQPAGLILNTTTLSLESGQTDNLVAYFDGAQITPTWSSNNTSVATVDASGKITAKSAGNAVITATYQGKQVTCTVNVTEPDTRLKGSNYYVFMLDDITYSKISSKVTADYRADDSKKFLQVWDGSYAAGSCEGKNAYGQELDWASLIAQQNPWGGVGACGLLVNDNISMSGIAGSDYADYYLHVDYKLTSGTTKQEILLYNVGSSSTEPAKTVELPTNNGADGWYSFDESLSSLGVSKDIFTDFVYSVKGKNVIGLRTTGAGKQFDVCGLYIYKPAK